MAKSLIFVIFLVWAGVALPGDTSLPALGIEEGRPFPDLALPSMEDGKPRRLSDFRGKKLVLHVFASW